MWIKSIFQMFSDNFYFSESPEIFRNIFRANFQIIFHCVFFRTIESVKVHELRSWSSYSNVSIRRAALDQPEFDITHSSYNKVDLIQFCSSRVFNIAWYMVILIHQWWSQIKLIHFIVSVKWLFFNRKKYYNQKKYYKWKN